MTTLLLAALLFVAYSAFIYTPQATDVPTPVVEATADEVSYPDEWLALDNTITKHMIGWDCVFNTLTETKLATDEAVTGLATYTIRELKKIASTYKVKRYSNMTKAQLCEALAALGCA